jgi:predicted methyltransferase
MKIISLAISQKTEHQLELLASGQTVVDFNGIGNWTELINFLKIIAQKTAAAGTIGNYQEDIKSILTYLSGVKTKFTAISAGNNRTLQLQKEQVLKAFDQLTEYINQMLYLQNTK